MNLHHPVKLALYCCNTRISYLLRAVPTPIIQPLMLPLDAAFESFFADSLSFEDNYTRGQHALACIHAIVHEHLVHTDTAGGAGTAWPCSGALSGCSTSSGCSGISSDCSSSYLQIAHHLGAKQFCVLCTLTYNFICINMLNIENQTKYAKYATIYCICNKKNFACRIF